MSIRDDIASLLWWAVPSSDDAEAKAITADLLDRYRAEVLREAADAVAPDAFGYGGPGHDDAWTAAEEKLRRMADEAGGEPTRQEAEAADQPITAIRRVKEDGRWVVRWRLGGRRRQLSCDTGAEAYEYMRYLYAKAQDEGGGRDA